MSEILLIDDDPEISETIETILLDAGHVVHAVRCPDEAYATLKTERFDLILCDLNMPFTFGPEMDCYPYSTEVGAQTIKELGWVFPQTPIVGISSAPQKELSRVRGIIGDITILQKPISPKALLSEVTFQATTLPYLMA